MGSGISCGPVRIVLLGRSGSGKSEAGNNILGGQEFTTSFGFNPETIKCEKKTKMINGVEVTVIDTPDFFDSACTNPQSHIKDIRDLSAPGPHIFLLVMRVGRFIEGERNIVRGIKKIFGEKVTQRIIVLFTHGEDLRKKSIREYIKDAHDDLRELLSQCESRFHVFEKRTIFWNNSDVNGLFETIYSLMAIYKETPFRFENIEKKEKE